MFVRKKKNKSGSTSVQIIDTSGPKDKLIQTIGSSFDISELEELCKQGQAYIDQYQGQQQLILGYDQDRQFFQHFYHRLPGRISAHIIIAFAAYKLYKELERQLKLTKSYLSVEKAIELMKTIYRIKVQLPESKQEKDLIFAPDPAQKYLLSVFNVKIISD